MQQKLIKVLVMLASAGVLAVYQHFQQPNKPPSQSSAPVAAETRSNTVNSGDYRAAIDKIRRSKNDPDAKFWTTVQGNIVKVLSDDTEGSPHQRFLVQLSPDTTLLVAHNVDLAQRVPVQAGQSVIISGEYVWNNRGGVLHWTHHDPKGRKGGWIELAGKHYD
jgi:hypothetical protein